MTGDRVPKRPPTRGERDHYDRDWPVSMTDPNPCSEDAAEAHRRVGHLVMLLSVEGKQDEFHQEIARLAGIDGDPDFLALVIATAIATLNGLLLRYPEDERRELAFKLLEMGGTPDMADLERLLQEKGDTQQ